MIPGAPNPNQSITPAPDFGAPLRSYDMSKKLSDIERGIIEEVSELETKRYALRIILIAFIGAMGVLIYGFVQLINAVAR